MKTILKKFRDGMIFAFGAIFIFSIAYAIDYSATTGETLTATKWNDLVAKVDGVFTDGSGNVGIGTETPNAKLEVNGTIRTDASSYIDVASIMPNDMSYGAGGYSIGTPVTLDMGVYLVKYYMCTTHNSLTGGAKVSIISNSGEIKPPISSHISYTTNGGGCGFFESSILNVLSDNAQVSMKVAAYYVTGTNTDNNPTANSVSTYFTKIY